MAKARYRTQAESTGALAQPLPQASAATIDGSAFISVTATDPIPLTWEERARKAWTYYVEEPLVKNCVNSWRCFAVGDEIKLASDDDAVKEAVIELHDRLALTASAALNEVLILPEDEVGKMPIRETLKTEAIDRKERFKTGWLVWSELGQGILRPDILVKIKLLGVNNPPTVGLSNPSTVNLQASVIPTATDGDTGLANLLILWGDGEVTETVTSGQDYQHDYAQAGTYRITLVATDKSGQTATATKTVVVTAG